MGQNSVNTNDTPGPAGDPTGGIAGPNDGLGSLLDADPAQEPARLRSLQARQQQATQALASADPPPRSLLSLFK